jgi:hypothetical protein
VADVYVFSGSTGLESVGVEKRESNAETLRAQRIRRGEDPMAKRKTITKTSRKSRAKKKKATLGEVREIARSFREHIRGPLIDDHAELLYDEKGLPK